jgi:hypothetical protein
MGLPDIDFEKIRPFDGSKHTGFEELTAQLASLEDVSKNTTFYRKGRGGDAGVECFRRFSDGHECGWQAKYLFSWDDSLPEQLDKSIRTALDKHPQLTEYTICIPFDLPDSRPKKGRSALQKWEDWKEKWEKEAKDKGRELKILLWGRSEFISRLTKEGSAYGGRLLYWFGAELLTTSWFEEQFAKTKASLGSRYSPESNVDLPIRKAYLGFARDPILQSTLDGWFLKLKDETSGCIRAIKAALPKDSKDIYSEPLTKAVDELSDSLSQIIGPESLYPISDWIPAIEQCQQLARDALYWVLDFPSTEKNELGSSPRDSAIRCLRDMLDILSTIREDLRSEIWRLVNTQTSLLIGPAGIGKSHLLADVVEHQIQAGKPAIMILGSSLSNDEPWHQIIRHLDLPPTYQIKHFLGALDSAAEARGVRAIICVDAINERHGHDIWPTHIVAFLKTIEPFPRVCVALSCRSTYKEYVIPTSLKLNLPELQHLGFGGNSGAAAKVYLTKRGIIRPGAPNLASEFDNPLFLKTCCDYLDKEGKRELPKGLQGITAIFGFYNEAIANALTERMKLDRKQKIIQRAIAGFAKLLLASRQNYILQSDAISYFEGIRSSGASLEHSLLSQLENEGILSTELVTQDDGSTEEMVRFTFERMSDHEIAFDLLNEELAKASVIEAFSEGSKLHQIIFGEYNYRYRGIIEAIAIQLPEKKQIEILDIGDRNWYTEEAFKESLLWRNQAYFSDRTLQLLKEEFPEHLENTLIALATEPANKFNAKFLDSALLKFNMPERDRRWSIYVAKQDIEDHPIGTLIYWVFENGMDSIDNDRAELAAITLSWLLATTNRSIRDRATKALAALFSVRLDLARLILKKFSSIDDLYIFERILAATYGAVLQGVATTGISELAQTIYELVFLTGNPPINALVRDNAYGIIKYAEMRKELPVTVKASNYEPPYNSPWPIEAVSDELVESYVMSYGEGKVFTDPIVSSAVHDGDFARYIIDSCLDDWSPAPIGTKKLPTYKDIYLEWLSDFKKNATASQQSAFSVVFKMAEAYKRSKLPHNTAAAEQLKSANEQFRKTLTAEQWEDYLVRAKNRVGLDYEHDHEARFNTAWARRWICKRAHDLGWNAELFGEFDRVNRYDRHNHSVERIGKKYQWLAFYELAARMSDNLAYLGGYFKYEEGAWRGFGTAQEIGIRNIDPSLLITKTHHDGWAQYGATWWVPSEPKLRSIEPVDRMAWLDSKVDIINDISLIDLYDPKTKEQWLSLNGFSHWRQHGLRGDKKEFQRETWFRLRCIVVKAEDEEKFYNSLKMKMLTDPHSLPSIDLHGDHYLGEYPWHPTVNNVGDWSQQYTQGDKVTPTRATVANYTCERGGYDYSIEDTIRVVMPAPWLAKALNVRLSNGRQINFVNSNGEVIFYDPSVYEKGPQAALVKKSSFLEMLKREQLSAIWVISGEKSVYGGDNLRNGFGGRHLHTGIYRLKDNSFEQKIYTEREYPSRQQLETLFQGGPIPDWIVSRE